MVAETRASKRRATFDQQNVSAYIQQDSYSSPYHQQTPYHQFTSSSAPQSEPSSLESSLSPVQQPNMLAPTHSQNPAFSAPMPSPSASRQMNGYFGSMGSSQTQQLAGNGSHSAQNQARILQGQSNMGGSHHVGQRGDGGGLPETAPFLKDFNLVAEAAKRAQMACLSRDLDEIGL